MGFYIQVLCLLVNYLVNINYFINEKAKYMNFPVKRKLKEYWLYGLWDHRHLLLNFKTSNFLKSNSFTASISSDFLIKIQFLPIYFLFSLWITYFFLNLYIKLLTFLNFITLLTYLLLGIFLYSLFIIARIKHRIYKYKFYFICQVALFNIVLLN